MENKQENGVYEEKEPLIDKSTLIIILVASCSLLLLVVMFRSFEKLPVKVGFIASLSGRHAALGVSTRDGVFWAVEKINEKGGLNGRRIEVISRDVKKYGEDLTPVISEFKKEGVVALIGPCMSDVAIRLVPVANKNKMLLISPTVSTPELSNMDDYFLRVSMPNRDLMKYYAEFLYTKKGVKKIAGAVEIGNRVYTEGLYNSLGEHFKRLGGKVLPAVSFDSGVGYRYIAESIVKNNPDAVIIAASSVDTALLSQEIRKTGSESIIAGSGWAFTEELLAHGGKSVEGIILVSTYFDYPENFKLQEFKSGYMNRFGRLPSFGDTFGFDAANVLISVLLETKLWSPEAIKEAILSTKSFKSVLGEVEIDKFGDPVREVIFITVKNGEFVKVE